MAHRLLLAAGTAGLVLLAAACSNPSPRDASSPPSPPQPALSQSAPSADSVAAGTVAELKEQEEPERRDRAVSASRMPSPKMAEQRLMAPSFLPPPSPPMSMPAEDRERYGDIKANPVQRVAEAPVSTFSIDVDTGAYANVRRFLQQGQLPPADAVRVEELVNYFDYAYDAPRDASTPFSVVTEMAPTPWNAKTHLLHVGIQGWKPQGPRPASNLVFLVDVSGSMSDPDKLPLVKSSLKLLTRELTAQDRISLVVYAGSTGVILEPTPGDQSAKINAAIDQLGAGGSTNGAAGIDLAYDMAQQGFIQNGVNRVLLATDGDFNVGVTSFERLIEIVEDKRKGGVALTTLGFGQGNYNEALMEQLADHGNGNYAYIDSLSEAQKVLVRQRDATLQTIARDVKIQIEFNPAQVSEYRLIGYENRLLKREDFSNDHVDAGEIGAGHRVTALYEVALVGDGGERIAPLRYGKAAGVASQSNEIAHLRLRYKRPGDGMSASSRLIERPLPRSEVMARLDSASENFRLSAAVAAFGQLLRGGQYLEAFDYTRVRELARAARGSDVNGEAGEFLRLVDLAKGLSQQQTAHAD